MEEAQCLCFSRGPARSNLGLVIMMIRRRFHLDMGVEGQGQTLVSRLIRVVVVPSMQMDKWVPSK